VLDFLRDTDPALLKRISRKLIYHLSWSGVEEAKEVLRRGGAIFPLERGLSADGNRSLPPDAPGSATDLTTEAFRIAEKHLSQTEILNCVTRWIKEDKAASWCEPWKTRTLRWERLWSVSNVIGT
jgi:hypothetical protein